MTQAARQSSTGTPKGIAVWYRNQRTEDGSTFELVALPLEGASIVASWQLGAVVNDVDEWCRCVDDAATNDAAGRDSTTRYELRHIGEDGRVRTSFPMRRVVHRPDAESERLDGSMTSILAQSQRATHQAHAQVIEMARTVQQTAIASASLAQSQFELTKLYAKELADLQAQLVVARDVAPPRQSTSVGDIAMQEVVKAAAPMLAAKFAASMAES